MQTLLLLYVVLDIVYSIRSMKVCLLHLHHIAHEVREIRLSNTMSLVSLRLE